MLHPFSKKSVCGCKSLLDLTIRQRNVSKPSLRLPEAPSILSRRRLEIRRIGRLRQAGATDIPPVLGRTRPSGPTEIGVLGGRYSNPKRCRGAANLWFVPIYNH